MPIKRKPAFKPAPKPAPKPTPKPAPAPAPASTPAPAPAPLDLVRNPNFDAAIAQQRYDQILADMTVRAQAGQFDAQRDEVGQRPPQAPQVGVGGFGDAARRLEQLGQLPYQQQFNPNAPSLMPIQTPGSNALNQDLANRGMGGGIPTPIPEAMSGGIPTPIPEALQGQQTAMAAYKNFLQQGIQNSNTLNQGAMASFANMQPGMQIPQVPQAGAQVPQAGAQIPQPTIAKPPRPNMVTQQRRLLPAQRKFSTVSNTPARFG